MTRAQVDQELKVLYANKGIIQTKTGLLLAMTDWLTTQSLTDDEKNRILNDLGSYPGFNDLSS